MTKRVPTAQDLQELSRDEWEALGHDLCATMYEAERVEDRLGRGNGLDAVRQLEPEGNIDGWQFRRFDDRLGHKQIEKLQEAITRAVAACKRDRAGELRTFTVFGNIDLQPGHGKAKGEDARFAEFRKWFKEQYNIHAFYKDVTWVRSRLLKYPHLRPNLFEDISAQIESLRKETLQAVGGSADTRKAFEELETRSAGQLAVLVREARTHFERGQKRGEDEDWQLAVESLRDAERLATAPGVEIGLLALIRSLLTGFLTVTGPLNGALETGRLAVAAAKAEGDASLLRLAQGNLAIALANAQEYEEARSLSLEVLRAYEDEAELSEVVRTLTHLLHIDTSIRNWSAAFTWAQRLHNKYTELDQLIGVTDLSLSALGNIAQLHLNIADVLPQPMRDEQLMKARDLFRQLIDASRLSKMTRTTIISECQFARSLHYLGQFDDANNEYDCAIGDADDADLPKVAADARYNQALMLMEGGRLDLAANAAANAAQRYFTLGDPASSKDAELLLAKIQNAGSKT